MRQKNTTKGSVKIKSLLIFITKRESASLPTN
jgi:hypothetical protein